MHTRAERTKDRNRQFGASFALARFVGREGGFPPLGTETVEPVLALTARGRGLGETRGAFLYRKTGQDECWEGHQVFPCPTSSVSRGR